MKSAPMAFSVQGTEGERKNCQTFMGSSKGLLLVTPYTNQEGFPCQAPGGLIDLREDGGSQPTSSPRSSLVSAMTISTEVMVSLDLPAVDLLRGDDLLVEDLVVEGHPHGVP